MNKIKVSQSVSDSTEHLIKSLQEKGFKIFCDINHQTNAKGVDLEMPESRVLIFGNPIAGTKLMQKDIAISFDLPLRVAIVDNDGDTLIVHQTSEDYSRDYQVENHPVLKKVDELFETLILELS